jgi:sugar phosphate isomerase/epimerase
MRITRRDVTIGAAAAAMGRLPAAPRESVRFGVRTPFPKQLSLRERAVLVRKLGYDGIELGPEWLNQPVEAIRKETDDTGVLVSAIVGSIQLLDTDPQKRAEAVEVDRRRLQMAKDLGAGSVIEVPTFGPNRFQDISPIMTSREVEERLLVAGLKQLAGDVKRSGVTLLLEPLTRKETHFMNLQSQGVDTIRAVGAPGFKLLSDFYHMQLEEKDIGETLAQYGKFTGYVHLADGEKRTEPGSLPFDYRPGFSALKKWGYSGWLTVECRASGDPESALGRALEYLKTQWAEA